MASLMNVGHGKKAEAKKAEHLVGDYVTKTREEMSPKDWTEAGVKFFGEVFGITSDEDADILCDAVIEYCEKYTKDKLSASGKPLADIGGFGNANRAFGALHGDRNLGGVIYTLGTWFDTTERQERLRAIIETMRKPKGKGRK